MGCHDARREMSGVSVSGQNADDVGIAILKEVSSLRGRLVINIDLADTRLIIFFVCRCLPSLFLLFIVLPGVDLAEVSHGAGLGRG